MKQRSGKIVVASAVIIAFLVFFSTVQYGLSTPITTPIVVKMDNSSGVNIASDTLKGKMPGTLIVDYDSPMYHLVIWRAYGGVIWIGHGSQEGVETQQGLVSWRTLADKVESTPSKDAILTCYSTTILGFVPDSEVLLSFKGEIDSELGALLVTYAFTGDQATLTVAFQHIMGLLNGQMQPVPLLLDGEVYVWGQRGGIHLTNYEFLAFFVPVVITVIFDVFIGWRLQSVVDKATGIILRTWTGHIQVTINTLFAAFQAQTGYSSWDQIIQSGIGMAIQVLAAFITAILGYVWDVMTTLLGCLDLLELFLIGLILAGSIALGAITGGISKAVQIGIAAASLVPLVAQLFRDMTDDDGSPPPPPEPPSGGGGGGGAGGGRYYIV